MDKREGGPGGGSGEKDGNSRSSDYSPHCPASNVKCKPLRVSRWFEARDAFTFLKLCQYFVLNTVSVKSLRSLNIHRSSILVSLSDFF